MSYDIHWKHGKQHGTFDPHKLASGIFLRFYFAAIAFIIRSAAITVPLYFELVRSSSRNYCNKWKVMKTAERAEIAFAC